MHSEAGITVCQSLSAPHPSHPSPPTHPSIHPCPLPPSIHTHTLHPPHPPTHPPTHARAHTLCENRWHPQVPECTKCGNTLTLVAALRIFICVNDKCERQSNLAKKVRPTFLFRESGHEAPSRSYPPCTFGLLTDYDARAIVGYSGANGTQIKAQRHAQRKRPRCVSGCRDQ